VRARDAKGRLVELHIELDGHIRKQKKLELPASGDSAGALG
jgi:hypothetical protein